MRIFLLTLACAGTVFADVESPAILSTSSETATVQKASEANTSVPRVWEPPFFNGIAAQVGKVLITYDDIRRELARLAVKIKAQTSDQASYDTQMEAAYTQILNGLVDRQLFIAEFDRKGYQLNPQAVEDTYQKILKETYNGKVSDLADELQHNGLTLPDFKVRLADNMKAQAMQQRFSRDLPAVTPAQIAAYYAAHPGDFSQASSVKVAVMTLKPMADEPASVVVQQAEALRASILGGADFSEMARTHSVDASASSGGVWDWTSLSDLEPNFQKAILNMKVGDVSNPIVTDPASGQVMLVKMLDRKSQTMTSLQDATPDIENILKTQQAKAAYDRLVDELRPKNYIKIY
jgi:peptidyl-prolyl cis-trans isomerase SurA